MLSGTIPFELNKLTKLKDLALFNQRGNLVQLHGPIPDFAASPQLSVIALGDNQLSGSIPDTLLSTSNVKDQRIRIGLANNLMTGVVPTSLNAFDNLALEITGNIAASVLPLPVGATNSLFFPAHKSIAASS